MLDPPISEAFYNLYENELVYLIKPNFDDEKNTQSKGQENNNQNNKIDTELFESVFFTSTKRKLIKFFELLPIQVLWSQFYLKQGAYAKWKDNLLPQHELYR